MREFTLQTELWLARPRDELFPFFAEARNLETLTPAWLKFELLTPVPITMRPGIIYEAMRWLPFRDFGSPAGGNPCTRIRLSMSPRGGALIDWLFVRRDVERIFRYSQQRMQELLGTKANATVYPASKL